MSGVDNLVVYPNQEFIGCCRKLEHSKRTFVKWTDKISRWRICSDCLMSRASPNGLTLIDHSIFISWFESHMKCTVSYSLKFYTLLVYLCIHIYFREEKLDIRTHNDRKISHFLGPNTIGICKDIVSLLGTWLSPTIPERNTSIKME